MITAQHARHSGSFEFAWRLAEASLPLLNLMYDVREEQDSLEAMKAAGAPERDCDAKSAKLTNKLVTELDKLVGEKYRKHLPLPHRLKHLGNYQHIYFVWAVIIAWMFESPPSTSKAAFVKYLCAELVSDLPLDSSTSYIHLDAQQQFAEAPTHVLMVMQLHLAALHVAREELPQLDFLLLGNFSDHTHEAPVGMNDKSIDMLIQWLKDDF